MYSSLFNSPTFLAFASLICLSPQQATCLLSVCWLHAMLTGVSFCGPTYSDLAVVAYDTDEVHLYKAA